jgi:cell wall-associated NlpC family hydrolase
MIEKFIRLCGTASSSVKSAGVSLTSAGVLILFALLLVSATTTGAAARNHSSGRHGIHAGKSRHSARHQGKRYAKLSRHHVVQKALTSKEKQDVIQKIEQLAKASVVPDGSAASDDSVVAAEANSLDIQSQIAEAAKEEQAEDNVDASIEQFFKARPGAIDANINPDTLRERQQDFTLYDESNPRVTAQRSDIMAQIIDWIGTRYVFGGENRGGIDCSAFTREVFQKAFGLELPRTAYMQSQLGDEVRKQDLQFGDLVFFRTARYAPITHVGIYIGEGLFANAACSRGVTVASLSSKYWSEHYIGARRLFTNSSLASTNAAVNSSTMADEVEGTTDR